MAKSGLNCKKDQAGLCVSPRDYDEAKRMACDPDRKKRLIVASCEDIAPEILYFMVDDPDFVVRREIAANAATPRQADEKLAHDEDEGVRKALAIKIAKAASGAVSMEPSTHCQMTLDILDKLARDQLPVVRQVVAEVLKFEANVPNAVIKRLARDIDIVVAAPILEFSPLLDDLDLIEIIESAPISGAVRAISRRDGVSGDVSASIAETDDSEAILSLLNNATAQFREDTLDLLVDKSRRTSQFQEPLVRRPNLPGYAACKLATFVADSLLTVLQDREDLDEATMEAVRKSVRSRISESFDEADGLDLTPSQMALRREYASACALHEKTPLTDSVISRSLDYEHWDFVTASLTVMSGYPLELVAAIMESSNVDLVTALCWKAGVGLEVTCLILQLQLQLLPPSTCSGTYDYPSTPTRMLHAIRDFASAFNLPYDDNLA